MNAMLMFVTFVLTSAVQVNDWTPVAAAEGAMVTIDSGLQPAPQPAPKPAPDGTGKGAKIEGPLDSYREAKALIEKGNALADRGKAILDQAQQDGKITVDIRLPTSPAGNLQFKPTSGSTCPNGNCPNRACPNGTCPYAAQAEDSPSAGGEPRQTCSNGNCKARRFLRWRR
jgi:hypothetical protein